MSKEKEAGGLFSVGLLIPLTLLFAAAKLFGFYDMSWLWVFSPFWVPLGILLLILIVLGFCTMVLATLLSVYEWWTNK